MLVTVITEPISSPGPDTISTTYPTTDPSTAVPPTTASNGQPSARPLMLITRAIQIFYCLFYFLFYENPLS